MIKNEKVLALAELKETLEKKQKEAEADEKEEKEEIAESALMYAKRFSKLKIEKVKELREELKKLDIMKLKERHIVKIADMLPGDAEDLRKIFIGEEVSLDQDEIEKILAVVKKYLK